MFLLDKYSINEPSDVLFHYNLYKKLLKLNNLNSWMDDDINIKSKFCNIPNLLIYGKNGCGKRSLINLFLKTIYGKDLKSINVKYTINGYGSNNIEIELRQSLYHIEIIPTNTGLDKYLVQEVIKKYASKNVLSFNTDITFKIIWIQGIDNMSYYAQTALRCIMEKYSKVCKFILTSKQLSKVIEPLISRCLNVRVPLPTNKDIMRVLMNISYQENKFLDLEQYSNIIAISKNNIKMAIIYLEMIFYNIPIEFSWEKQLKMLIKTFQKILTSKIAQKDIDDIRLILYKIFITNINGTIIIKELLKQIILSLKDYSLSYEIIDICTQYEKSLANGKRSIIHLEAFIFTTLEFLYKKYNM